MNDPQAEARRDYWEARDMGLPEAAADRYAEACRLGRLFFAERQAREKAEAELAAVQERDQRAADALEAMNDMADALGLPTSEDRPKQAADAVRMCVADRDHVKEELAEQECITEHLGECLESLVTAAMGDQGETAGAMSYESMTAAAYKAINRMRDELAEARKAVEVADAVAKMAAHDRDEALAEAAKWKARSRQPSDHQAHGDNAAGPADDHAS